MDQNRLPPDVVAALKAGNKIQAIKLLRLRMGLGLAEAKGQVDALAGLLEDTPRMRAESMDATDLTPAPRPSAPASRPSPLPRPRPAAYVKRDGLSPGEVPKTSGATQAAFVMIAIVIAIGLYIAFG
jgi:hypothetical protein